MKRPFLVAVATALVGCAHAQVFDMGSGRYRITCEREMGACIDEANDRCPDGYRKLDEGGEYTGARGAAVSAGGTTSVRMRSVYSGVLVVECAVRRRGDTQ